MTPGWEDSDFMAELQRYAQQSRTAELDDGPRHSAPAPAPAPVKKTRASRRASESGPVQEPIQAVPVPPVEPPAEVAPIERVSAPASLIMPEEEPSGDPSEEPGFVVQARRRAFWTSPAVRLVMGMMVLFLAGLLTAQWAIHERDQVAARWPAVRPFLLAACEPLACSVAPVRRIDDVVIDSSSLVRKLGDFYAFDLVLKNRAGVPVAVPALELSLTNIRDEVISRRVFLPNELPGLPAELPANGSLSTSLRLTISLGDEMPMSGYRALVFYP